MRLSILSLVIIGVVTVTSAYCLEIKSTAFADGGNIPVKFTCLGKDMSPYLSWTDVPEGTRSFVIIVDDPDAPLGTFVHWVAYNIQNVISELQENAGDAEVLSSGISQGVNDFGKIGYGGPCPPTGKAHRYCFTLYATDLDRIGQTGLTSKQVTDALRGHILAESTLTGLFKR